MATKTMALIQSIKGALGIAALAGAALLTGCSTAPVAEEIVVSDGCAAPVGMATTTAVVEPVGEFCGTEALQITTPRDRYYDPLMQSWERPWPFGPYGTANWR